MAGKTPEEAKKEVDKLKKEKSSLIEKNRSLAEIIEEITKEKDVEEPKSSKKDVEEEVSSAVRKQVDSEFAKIDEKLKDLSKISDLADTVKKLSEQIKSEAKPRFKKVQGPLGETLVPVDDSGASLSPIFGGQTMGTQVAQNIMSPAMGPVGKALASFGQDVDFQTEIIEIKNNITDLDKNLTGLQKKMEYRVSRLEEETKALDKISELEQAYDEISEKLSPENVQKLKRLIFSTDELVDEVLPDLINKRIHSRIDPILSDLGTTKNAMEVLNTRVTSLRNEIRELQKFQTEVNELGMNLKLERDRVNKKFNEQGDNALRSVEGLREETRKKLEKIAEDLTRIQTKYTQVIGDITRDMFKDIVDPKLSDIERGQIIFDERLKKLFESIEKVKTQVAKIQAPENLKEWIDDRGKEIEKKLQFDIVAVLKDKLAIVDSIRKEMERGTLEIEAFKKELPILATLQRDSLKHTAEISGLDERAKAIESLVKDIPKHSEDLDSLDERAKTLETMVRDVPKHTEDIGNLDERTKSIEALAKDVPKHGEDIANLKDRTRSLENATKDIPKQLDYQLKQITKLSDTKDLFGKDIERLLGETRSLNEKCLRNEKFITTVDTDLKSAQKSEVVRFDGVTKDIFLLNDNVKTLETFVNKLSADTGKADSELKEDIRDTRTTVSSFIEKKMEALRAGLEKVRDHDLREQVNEFRTEIKKVSGIETDLRTLKASQQEVNGKLIRDVSKLDGVPSDIKFLRDKLESLEGSAQLLEKKLGTDVPEAMGSLVNAKFKEISTGLTTDVTKIRSSLDKESIETAERLESQQSQINKIMDTKESLAKQVEATDASVKSLTADLKGEKERIVFLEKEALAMAKLNESRLSDVTQSVASLEQDASSQGKFTQILAKNISQAESTFTKSLEGLRSELSTNLNKGMSSIKEEMEKKIDADAKDGLEHFRSEISKVGSMEQSLLALEKSYNTFADKSKTEFGNLQTTPQEIHILKQKVRELETTDKDLDKKFNSLTAPENIKKWFDAKVEDFRKDLSREIYKLETQIGEQSEDYAVLKDAVLTLKNISRDVPAKLEKQQSQMLRIIEAKDAQASQMKAMETSFRQLAGDLDSERDRLAAVEKLMEGAHESRLDGLSSGISAVEQEVANIQGFATSLAKDFSAYVTEMNESVGKIESNVALRFDKSVSRLRDELASSRDKEFKVQVEKFRQEMERVASLEKGLRSLDSDSKQVRKEHSTKIGRLENIATDLKYLRDRIAILETENRKLAGIVSDNQIQLASLANQKAAEQKKIEREIGSQKEKIAGLLKELRK
jgi:DNA repair exonuclease SbcCD ATPase subunit